MVSILIVALGLCAATIFLAGLCVLAYKLTNGSDKMGKKVVRTCLLGWNMAVCMFASAMIFGWYTLSIVIVVTLASVSGALTAGMYSASEF